MRYSLAILGGLTIGLVANQALAQVAAMGGMGRGGGNPRVPGADMNRGASIANLGGNARFGGLRYGAGRGYGGTAQASVVGSSLGGVGGYPAVGDARYLGQNYSTSAGSYGTGAGVANQPGQPSAFSGRRSTFAGAVANYNAGVRSAVSGPYGGQGLNGPVFGGFSQPNYVNAGTTGAASLFGNGNMSVAGNPVYNGLPSYTYGLSFPAGYAPYRATQISSPVNYPVINSGVPGYTYGRSFPAGYAPYRATQISAPRATAAAAAISSP